MAKGHKQSIIVTPEFHAAVELYRQQHELKAWSEALIKLASAALNWDKPAAPGWGGDRKSEAYREFVKRLDKMSAAEAEAFLESIEG